MERRCLSNPKLTRCFKSGDRDGTTQIDTADVFVRWNSQQLLVGILSRQRGRQALRLTTKHEHIALFEFDIQITTSCESGVHPDPFPNGIHSLQKVFPVIGDFPFKMLPIVQPRPPQGFLGDLKTKRPDQPQLCPQGNTSPPNRSSIGRNFRLVENDV